MYLFASDVQQITRRSLDLVVDLTLSEITPRACVARFTRGNFHKIGDSEGTSAIAASTTFRMATQTDVLKATAQQDKTSLSVDACPQEADFYWVTDFN